MPTYAQRELAGVSPISEQALPTQSKHDSDEAYKKSHELAQDNKALRELDGTEITPYKHEITDVLWNPRDKIMQQINAWNYKIITSEESMHTPYRRAA